MVCEPYLKKDVKKCLEEQFWVNWQNQNMEDRSEKSISIKFTEDDGCITIVQKNDFILRKYQ